MDQGRQFRVCDTGVSGVGRDQGKLVRGCDKGVGVPPKSLWLGVTHGGVQQ